MDKESRLRYKIERIKLGLKKIGIVILRSCPNIIIESAIFIVIISSLCFSGSVASNIVKNIDMGGAQHDASAPSQKLDFELNTETELCPENTESTEPQRETIQYNTSQMCFIGDSRVVGMETAVYTDAHFIAKSSIGLDWFNETASIEFEKIGNEIKICVVALGISDLWELENYITTLNEFAEKYPDVFFVYSTIGPVDETQYTVIPNSSIEEFNKSMIAGLSDRWQIVDQYTYLASNGFSSYDGLHYGNAVSAGIFAWIVESVSIQIINDIN